MVTSPHPSQSHTPGTSCPSPRIPQRLLKRVLDRTRFLSPAISPHGPSRTTVYVQPTGQDGGLAQPRRHGAASCVATSHARPCCCGPSTLCTTGKHAPPTAGISCRSTGLSMERPASGPGRGQELGKPHRVVLLGNCVSCGHRPASDHPGTTAPAPLHGVRAKPVPGPGPQRWPPWLDCSLTPKPASLQSHTQGQAGCLGGCLEMAQQRGSLRPP